MSMLKMIDLDLNGKRVLIREDLNVPMKNGKVSSDARIRAALPTLKHALEAGAAVIVMSHLGRPKAGEWDPAFSLAPVASCLGEQLGREVKLVRDWSSGLTVVPGEVVLLENVRFQKGETGNDADLAQRLAALCDIFVMDAFGTAHRAHASTHGVARFASVACAGPLLATELETLEKALANPVRPMTAIVGGSKVSTKLAVLETLSDKVDQLIVGGGIANTFIAAAGYNVGKSLYEKELIPIAKALMEKVSIPLPSDVVVAKAICESAEAVVKAVDAVADDEMILDIGPDSAARLAALLQDAKTIIWNGPVGVFEFEQFGEGTRVLSQAIADSEGFSIAGGGDTLAAVDKYGIVDKVSYISTGGGAFLEYVEGKTLPAVEILEARSQEAATAVTECERS